MPKEITTIRTSIVLPSNLHDDAIALMGEFDTMSDYIRRALRAHNRRVKLRNITEFVSEMSEEEKKMMVEEIKKGS